MVNTDQARIPEQFSFGGGYVILRDYSVCEGQGGTGGATDRQHKGFILEPHDKYTDTSTSNKRGNLMTI